MSLKGIAMTDKVLRGKINSIRQIEDVNALYAEAERLIESANQVIEAENVLSAAEEATEKTEGAIKNANDAASRAESYLEDAERLRTEIEDDWYRIKTEDIPEYLQSLVVGLSKIAYIDLLEANWVEEGEELYSQEVSVAGVTENSFIEICYSLDQIKTFREKDITLFVENDNGKITVICVGQKPTKDYEMQVKITEVVANG